MDTYNVHGADLPSWSGSRQGGQESVIMALILLASFIRCQIGLEQCVQEHAVAALHVGQGT